MNPIKKYIKLFAGKTFKREFALFAILVWAAVTVRLFYFSSGEQAMLHGGNYTVLSGAVWAFTAAACGLQQWNNVKAAQVVPAQTAGEGE